MMTTMQNISKVGAGLQNLANNCFVSSVLQCLTHTAPLADYLLTGEHSYKCHTEGLCMMCVLETHTNIAFAESGSVISPELVTNNLKSIAQHFELGRQEDAQEFLVFLIAQLRNSSIYDTVFRLSSDQSKDSNIRLIENIFVGTLQTQVVCQSCHYTSERSEEFLDIPLEMNTSTTILESLKNFTRTERLEGKNSYRCNGCYQLVPAEMRSTIYNPPNVLIMTLKRFNMFTGQKLRKNINYPETFDIGPYTSRPNDHINYNLYAVIVHRGYSATEGHYYAYVKAGDGQWYKMNDEEVTPCSISKVLQQQAYLLFYKKAPTEPFIPKPDESSSEAPKASEVEKKSKETEANSLPNIETVQEEEKNVKKKNCLAKFFCTKSPTNDEGDKKKKKNKKKNWLLRLVSPKSSTNDKSKEKNKEEKTSWLRKLVRRK